MGPALNLLLDTSTLLWVTTSTERVSRRARAAVDAPGNELWVSSASAWEVTTKYRLGRLGFAAALAEDWDGELDRYQLRRLDITHDHALRAGRYEVTHADPFDRMIAAQAELEAMTVVSSDRAFDLFPVRRLW